MEIRVAINGFGRIGRQLARHILTNPTQKIKLVAINTLEDINDCAFLLKHDSCHGPFSHEIRCQGHELHVGKNPPITFYDQQTPATLPWEQGIDIVIESSGKFTSGDKARGHLEAGAKKVIITAAAPFASDITICQGINHHSYDPRIHHVISASSCTTNCIAPVIHVIHNTFGFDAGMATFLHSYTSSQPLLDSGCTKLRCARNAATNIIPTTTSAEAQLPLIIPAIKGRFKAIAIRVPTPVIHLADLTVKLPRAITTADLLEAFKEYAGQALHNILSISNDPLVSVDHKNTLFSAVIDGNSLNTIGNMAKILIWHDNEFSYSRRILDLISHIGSKP